MSWLRYCYRSYCWRYSISFWWKSPWTLHPKRNRSHKIWFYSTYRFLFHILLMRYDGCYKWFTARYGLWIWSYVYIAFLLLRCENYLGLIYFLARKRYYDFISILSNYMDTCTYCTSSILHLHKEKTQTTFICCKSRSTELLNEFTHQNRCFFQNQIT